MPKAKTFFYVCAGFLCLALAYHLGARSAMAQSGSNIVSITGCLISGHSSAELFAVGSDGSVYTSPDGMGPHWRFLGTISGASPVQESTWGQVKARYR